MQNNWKRYTVTCALPYANGPIHIGHLAGVYIPADIYVRYLKIKKRDVVFICGSDEHGVPITIKALQEGISPKEVVDRYHSLIKKSFEDFGIAFDIYSRTTNKIHYETASEFFKSLYDKNIFIEKITEQYYDTELNQFLADRYIVGTCPHCQNDRAYGDQCEKCGTSLNPTDLINPKSVISGSQLVLKETKHWFLPLNNFENDLKKWILEEHKEWKTNVYGQCKSWLDLGLQPRAVTRDLDWGVPVPLEEAKGKVLYVWFDAPIGYISATKELTNNWEKYWKDKDTCLIHFIGKDNIVFHCIVFPAMLMAEGSYILPENVPANEFLNLEGDKISTSRNWAVWLHEYLEEFPGKQDVLRYVLTANMPETKDNDFTWKDFQTRNNNELVAILGNFVNRTLVLTNKYFEGKVPLCQDIKAEEFELLQSIVHIKENIEKNIENFKFREALKEYMNIARIGNKYLTETEPWKVIETDIERAKAIIAICLELTGALAILGEPFLVFTSQKLKRMLNISDYEWDDIGKKPIFKAGHKIEKAEKLFEIIDNSQIEYQLEKLRKSKQQQNQANIASETNHKPLKSNISYNDFEKLDLRVVTIIDAERVPNTDKLLKLTVDLGFEKRTVVSGVAQDYEPKELIGKQACLLANLEPRKIKGIESKGMLLFADNNGKHIAITTEKITINGSTIS
jgi:methionyl-tRNA synthetase